MHTISADGVVGSGVTDTGAASASIHSLMLIGFGSVLYTRRRVKSEEWLASRPPSSDQPSDFAIIGPTILAMGRGSFFHTSDIALYLGFSGLTSGIEPPLAK